MIEDSDLELLEKSHTQAVQWYERSGRYPEQISTGQWRWWLGEPGMEVKLHESPSELPQAVFDKLASTQQCPWMFASRVEAILMARIAAQRAILAGWQPPV